MPPPQADAESLALLEWVDAAADRFEKAWQSGTPPDLNDFLGDASGERRVALLRELVRIDLEYRRKTDPSANLEQYRLRFPELSEPDAPSSTPRSAGPSGDMSTTDERTARTAVELADAAAIGGYVVVSKLDEGGQSVVYRAVHRLLGREAVLKVAREPFRGGEAARSRLLAEGRVLAELHHPHLAQVYDVGFHEDRPYLAMEYVRGRHLEQYLAQARPTPKQLAALLAPVARALAAAHCRGVIHRDIKPKNIVIADNGRPCLIDFGLALTRNAWSEDRTSPGLVCGTPSYMAPEQARADAEKIGPPSDVFGLGAVLYYALTGQAPFAAPNATQALARAGKADLDRGCLERAPGPRRLKAICLKALAADPTQRHANAEALAEELEAVARPPARWPWLAAGILALVLVAAALVWQYARRPGTHPAPLPGPVMSRSAGRLPTEFELKVWRHGEPFSLAEAVPLVNHDRLQVRALIPAGMHASLFLVNSKGELRLLRSFAAGPSPTVVHFPDAQKTQELDGPPGTELVFLVAGPDAPPTAEEMAALWGPAGPWPALPSDWIWRVEPSGVDAAGLRHRDLGEVRDQADPAGFVQDRLDTLRLRLAERYPAFAGLAFPHQARAR